MQSYVLNLAPAAVRPFDVPADLFVYESGTPTPTTGDTRIKVKPNTGAEIVLRPGQRFRLAPDSNATHWEVSALDPTVTLTGYVIIGSGEFDDANTLNKVTLDATFANTVTVTSMPGVQIANTPAARIPTTADLSQTIPVSIAGTVNVAGSTINYSSSWTNNTSTASGVPIQIVAPAANINGIMVSRSVLFQDSNGPTMILAKASAPATWLDGDVIACAPGAASASIPVVEDAQIKIPAGRGLWLISPGIVAQMRSLLYTIL